MKAFANKYTLEVGVDEAGRGPLLGRVYAGAVFWPPELELPTVRIDDSKKLRPRALEEAYHYVKENAIAYGVAYCTEEEIKSHNILHAAMTAMHRAIDQCQLEPDLILVDGNYFDMYLNSEGEPVDHLTVKGGDATYLSIAAASILAKWERDQYIYELCKKHPELDERYSISSNKGYGSQAHRDGIKKYGITQFHRNFGICKKAKFREI